MGKIFMCLKRRMQGDPELAWEDNSSAGEYITGLIRNRMSGGNITAVTLRELFMKNIKKIKSCNFRLQRSEMEVWKWKYKSGKY